MTYVNGTAWSGDEVWGATHAVRHEPGRQPTWFGQPRGLTVLFLTEMWEQFSYFGMRALLVYYMTKQLLIGQEKASFIYGIYTGWRISRRFSRCDRRSLAWQETAVIIGGSIMAAGHFMMTFEPTFISRSRRLRSARPFSCELASQINDSLSP